ncbi:MAG: amidohydrolase family protein, partial [Bacteroidota bacterium]|nr:amidohydrolase family protein [Bacteroidota bacterium]
HIEEVAPKLIAFTNATVHVDARTALPKATLVVKDGKVILVGEKVKIPEGAVVRDMKGSHIWPSLIEPYSTLGPNTNSSEERKAEWKGARHWNGALRAETQAHLVLRHDIQRSADLRKAGFGTAYVHRMDGIARGTSMAIVLDDEDLRKSVIQPDLAAHFSFQKGSSPDNYPNSQMGAIALIRQSFIDANWIADRSQHEEADAVMAALAAQLKGRIVVEAADRNEVLRWAKILNEFQLPAIIKGGGDEYARIDRIRAIGMPMLIPMSLPEAYDVKDPFDAQEVSFARLKHWEYAPFNAAILDSAQVQFAFTTHGRKDLKDFWRDLRRMVLCGLDSARAIEAFTIDPARFFGMDDRIGSLREGMIANFMITSDHLLAEKNQIKENWVHGKRFVFIDADEIRMTGSYDLNLAGDIFQLDVTDMDGRVEAFVRKAGEADSLRVKAELSRRGTIVSLSFPSRQDPATITRLSGSIHRDGGLWEGQGQKPGGSWTPWSAIRKAAKVPNGKGNDVSEETALRPVRGPLHHPSTGFGWIEPPLSSTTIFRNATVWTGTSGKLLKTDVIIHQGRIHSIGTALDINSIFPGRNKPDILEIDGPGLHLTAGIVDEHSHIAISGGVNESGYMI